MSKYAIIFRLAWQNTLVYRLNFFMWRLRSIIGFLGSYLFWLAIINSNRQVGGYNEAVLLSYIFVAGFLRNLVLSNVSYSACMDIANGDLSNFLIKPLGYFTHWFSRDLADKALNLGFFSLEISLLYLVLKPEIVWPSTWFLGLAFILVSLLAAILFFYFSFLVSTFAFWHPEHNGWPLRFLFMMSLDLLSGASIPLDIFPPLVLKIFQWSPFSYLVFYPAQIWLGRADTGEIINIFLMTLFWVTVFYYLLKLVWRRGILNYGAYGR